MDFAHPQYGLGALGPRAPPGKGGIVDYVIARVSEFTALHRVWGGRTREASQNRASFDGSQPRPEVLGF